MIRAVVFDFGGVLMRTLDPAGRRAWESRLGLDPGALELIIHQSDLWIEAQQGLRTPESYWEGVRERLGLSPADLIQLRRDYFSGDVLDRDLITLIESLRAQGYKVGLLSNDSLYLEEKLRVSLGITDCFDAVVISAQIGVMKPEAQSYRAIAHKLGLSLPECVFIDDNTANVDGARGVGMKAILYRAGMDVSAALAPVLEQDRTRAVIFDYGNVLDIPTDWETWRIHRDAFGARFGMTGDDMGVRIYQSEAWAMVKVGVISFQVYLEQVFGPLGVTDPQTQEALFWEYHQDRLTIHPIMLKILHQLKESGRYKLSILSNAWQQNMAEWLAQERGLGGIFDDVVSSAEVGIAKPDREIYHLALQRLGLRPGEAIFIDDLSRNTVEAEAIGLPCIVCESPEQVQNELQARGILP